MTKVIYSIFIYLNMSSMFLVSEILTLAACVLVLVTGEKLFNNIDIKTEIECAWKGLKLTF